jgi:hypothetical protein
MFQVENTDSLDAVIRYYHGFNKLYGQNYLMVKIIKDFETNLARASKSFDFVWKLRYGFCIHFYFGK